MGRLVKMIMGPSTLTGHNPEINVPTLRKFYIEGCYATEALMRMVRFQQAQQAIAEGRLDEACGLLREPGALDGQGGAVDSCAGGVCYLSADGFIWLRDG